MVALNSQEGPEMTQLPRPVIRQLGTSAAVTARSFGAKVAAAAAVIVLAFVVGAPAALADSASPRHGVLSVTKECSEFTGLAGSFCTIKTSNLKAIKPGSRVIYTDAAGAAGLDTNIVLYTGPGNSAFGHVVLNFGTKTGTVTFNGGTGKFRHFHAIADVSSTDLNPSDFVNWAWIGSYSFGPDD
jgi:hypothetical protein